MYIKRLYQYQKERFPILQYILLIFFFYYGFFGISRFFVGAKMSFMPITTIGAITVLLIFFQLRLFDEIKDNKIDSQYMPERAVPRGLISLKEIKVMLLTVTVLMFILNLFFGMSNFVAFTLMELYIFLMGKEFFIGERLKKNRLIYASLHMVAMSWIAFYVIQQAIKIDLFRYQHILLLILSYIIGFIMEIARKTEAPQNERDGVDTYSKLLGYKTASYFVLILSVVATLVMLIMFNFTNVLIIILLLIIPSIGIFAFLARPNKRSSKILESSASFYTLAVVIFFFIIAMRSL